MTNAIKPDKRLEVNKATVRKMVRLSGIVHIHSDV
jgi:hypothetical protein